MFDPFNSETANSISSDAEVLTYEKLIELAGQIPKLEFTGLTISPTFDRLLRHALSKDKSLDDLPFNNSFDSMNVFVVQKQAEGCIEWKDKDLMDLYLEMMEAKATNQTDRIKALQTISTGTGIGYQSLVLRTLETPTHHLEVIAPLVSVRDELISRTFDQIMPKLEIQMPKPIKEKRQRNEPFYAKFVKKKR